MMSSRRAYWRILPLGLLTLSLAGGCGSDSEAKTEAEIDPLVVPVTFAELERQTVEQTVPIEGTLKAWEDVTISAKKGGRVLRVHHDMGDWILPGEPLVDLETIDATLAIEQAETQYLGALVRLGISREEAEQFLAKYGGESGVSETLLRGDGVNALIEEHPTIREANAARDQARQNLTRQQQLNARGVGTLQDLQNTENDFRRAQATLDSAYINARNTIAEALQSHVALRGAERDLAEMKIKAPEPSQLPELESSGSHATEYAVTKRMVAEGQMLRDGEAVFELVIEDPIRLRANVPERYRPRIAEGQAVRISAMSQPGREFTGKVSRINPSVDPVSRTIQVEALIPNPDGLLRPGGFSKGVIITRTDQEAVVVPIESVYRYAGVTKIFLVEENDRGAGLIAQGYSIATGRQLEGGRVEIASSEEPLPSTGQVITTGLTKLAEGTPVSLREPVELDEAKPEPESITTR